MAGVVSDDERHLVRSARVVADELARCTGPTPRAAGTAHDADTAQLPQSIRPVVVVGETGGLCLGKCRRRCHGRDLAGAVTLVVAEAVDVEVVVGATACRS